MLAKPQLADRPAGRNMIKIVKIIGITMISADAVGIGFEYASAQVSAKGNTGVTNLGSASAVHYNPGALSFLEEGQVEVNVFTILGEAEWNQDGTIYEADDDPLFSGTAYVSYPIELGFGKSVVGAGLTSSYGQSVSWDPANPARDAGYEGELALVQYQLSFSHQFNDSLGIGVTWNWVDSELESVAGVPGIPGIPVPLPDSVGRFEGDGTANFFQFGILYNPTEDWYFGAAYRSSFDLNHEGSFSFDSNSPIVPVSSTVDAELEFELPPHVILGISYTGFDDWTISLQSQWTGWSTFDEILIETDDGLPDTPLIVDWEDGWVHSIGVSYDMSDYLTLHTGYVYVESIIPDQNQTLTVADFEQHLLSAGVSYETNKWGADLAVVYAISEGNTIEGSLNGLDGDHDASALFINLGGRWKY